MEPSMALNTVTHGDCLDLLPRIPSGAVDMVLTSPPYDNLRDYKGYSFQFEPIARELYRVLKSGGVMVWVVADATVNGSETGTSFKQALYFKEIGFNLHDTMIWEKTGRLPTQDRYYNVFEYMFVFSKGKPYAMNFICDHATVNGGRVQRRDKVINKGNNVKANDFFVRNEFARRPNIWKVHIGRNVTEHPAVYPVQLAGDHITTWSNPGDVVLDPFFGSGTTGVACQQLGRNFIGLEISPEYCEIAIRRLSERRDAHPGLFDHQQAAGTFNDADNLTRPRLSAVDQVSTLPSM